jgi:predicted DNA-binding WGR domain protein
VRRWEFVGGKSEKFWEADLTGTAVTSRYGRIGTSGQTTVKEFDSPTKAEAYLRRVIAEKEKKGYSEAGGTPGGVITETPAEDKAEEPPHQARDEDTFELPGAWRRVLHPRRGGIPRPAAELDKDAAREVTDAIREAAELLRGILDDPHSDPRLVKEARAHLDGEETPCGAALVGEMVMVRRTTDGSRFADAWAGAHGLAFTARAVAEVAGVTIGWNPGPDGPDTPCLRSRPAGEPLGRRWTWHSAAARLRVLLARAGERDYREVVDALAGHRRTAAQRLVVSYLLPTEKDWVDECCATPPAGREDATERTLLFCALGSADQVAALGPVVRFGWDQWSLDVIATTAEGVGTSVAPLLAGALDEDSTHIRKLAVGVLSQVPSDEAFQLLLDRVDQKFVQPALLEAMRRYPVRALRLLAQAAGGSSGHAAAARRLLTGHLLAEPEPTAAALPGLPAQVRAVVEKISTELVRIETAAPEDLPRPLADPPWTRRGASAKPVVITGLERPPVSRVAWAPGEKDQWADAAPHYSYWRSEHWDEAVRRYQDPQAAMFRGHEEVGLFLHGPEDLVRPLLPGWRPRYESDVESWMKPIAARYELAALDAVLDVAVTNRAHPAALLLPYVDVRVARLMADWLVRLKSARGTALAWFERHGGEAALLLVPDAVGAPGRARADAEAALRAIASAHDDATVLRAARSHGAEAEKAVEALLAADPLDTVPARLPKIGTWADPALLPQVLLRDRTLALPPESVGHLLTMLGISRPGEVYAGLAVVRETCDPTSLAEFGWAVFERWRMAGMPAKDGWALTGLGWIGDDETVRRLTPVIRAWPGQGGHSKAVTGLDVLAAIGTEIALVHLNGIAQRIKFKALQERAREKIEKVAEGLGLSREQLADRLVPDFGLDEDGSMVLDYGPRRFVVGFDEQLKPYVLDENGKRRKDLPAPGARDDAERATAARKRFADLKKDVRTVAGDVIRRLETAMVAGRDWSVAEFTDLFVRHPLTWHLARRLVWTSDGTAFRVAEDRTLADVADDALEPPDGARIHLAYPLDLAGSLDAWSEVFADYEILQPFPQLGRGVYLLTDEERAGSCLTRFEGVVVPTGKVLGLERHGWTRETPQDAGIQGSISREAGEGRFIVVGLDPGIVVGALDMYPQQELRSIWISDHPDGWGRRDANPARFGDLDPVTASEVIGDLTDLTELAS